MKKNLILLAVLTVLYIGVLAYAVAKLVSIVKHPDKYREKEVCRKTEEFENGRKYFRFFKSLGHQYSCLIACPLLLLGTGAYAVVSFAVGRLLSFGGEKLFFGVSVIGIVCAFLIGVPLWMAVIPLHIKTPRFSVMASDAFNCREDGRTEIWKKAYLTFSILFALVFPFQILSLNTYGYYDDKGIYSSSFFQIEENYTSYEDIQGVSVYIHHANNGKVDTFVYKVTLNDGKKIDVNRPNTSNQKFCDAAYEIHLLLEKKYAGEIEIQPLNETDRAFIENNLSAAQKERAYYIFEGLHK